MAENNGMWQKDTIKKSLKFRVIHRVRLAGWGGGMDGLGIRKRRPFPYPLSCNAFGGGEVTLNL